MSHTLKLTCFFCNKIQVSHIHKGCEICLPIIRFCDTCYKLKREHIKNYIEKCRNCECVDDIKNYIDNKIKDFVKINQEYPGDIPCILCRKYKCVILRYHSYKSCQGDFFTFFCKDCLKNRQLELSKIIKESTTCSQC